MINGHLPSRLRRRPTEVEGPRSVLRRQWELLEWLSASEEGVAVAEAAHAMGVAVKTIRRDLIDLRKMGFDLRETVEVYNRKRWRLVSAFESLRTRRQRYRAIRDNLDVLLDQAAKIDDDPLVKDLRAVRRRVARKCR